MPGKLYKAGALEPIANIGDRVMLLDNNGPIVAEATSGVYEVTFVEPVFGPGPHGTVLLWSQSSTPPSGYGTALNGAGSGSIAAGSSVTSQPTIFNMSRRQLLQFRWLPRPVNLPGGLVMDDLDFTVALPQGTPRFTTLNGQSRWNARFQAPLPSDTASAPNQAGNQSAPSTAGYSAADYTNLNELYQYEQAYSPVWTIVNNGSQSFNQGAIALDVFGFRLDLLVIAQPEPYWVDRLFQGKLRKLPPDVVCVPITGRGAVAQTQA